MSRAHVVLPSPIGELTVVAEDGAITHLLMDAAKYRPDDPQVLGEVGDPADEPFAAAGVQLAAYFTGVLTEFDLPLAPRGDDFHQRVWALLREIPHGGTTTYGALAAELGNPALAQRVGQAVGRNPVSVIVPCHRVVGSDGRLTGFAGGLERKQFLLELEEPAEVKAGRLF